ncbi:MAG TPA: carboxypeptidase-like regulatory domain-containing protein [Vicinamibacterales bacterium]|nr:carboxypeptidase-like regulatory domain-containing protein [Vicinamibacterales bacterium]
MLALLFVPLATSTAWAQTFTGGVRGVVTDSGGVVPGVTVTLINEANGATRDSVSNERGLYDFSAVPPGEYTVKAELTGFKTFENKGIRVGTQQFVTLDIRLDVGQLQETITVTGEAPLIDTSNASTGSVIDSRQLETLPSGGRSAFLFAVTVPTVVASGDAQFNRQQDQTNASLLSLGGGARRANNYLVDGVPVTDLRNRASANPSIESLEGVNVQVHQYDAETGRTGGGTFNTATKSGGNQWRGSGFYQGRPRWGSSNNYFSERTNIPKPETYFHLGGGAVGGPIARNRTFFWFSTEGYGSNTTRNQGIRLPTMRERQGDFSQSFAADGSLRVIYDPLTGDPNTGAGRQPFPGNVIPANRLNPISVKMLSYLPAPMRDQSRAGVNNWDGIAQIHDRAIMYTTKIDHRFSDKVSLAGYYLYNKSDEPCANQVFPGLNDPNRFMDRSDYLLLRRVNVLALNNTWLPGNNTVATLRYGMTRFIDDDTLSIEYDPAQLGFSQNYLSQMQVKKMPRVDFTDGYYSFGAIDPTPRNWYSWSANGTVSKLMGSHTIKLGADWRTIGIKTQSFTNGAGRFFFDNYFTSQSPTTLSAGNGNSVASMLLGFPSGQPGNESRLTVSSPFNAFVHYMGGYIQDDWRVNSKFTLNYGLRVERETGLREENNGLTVAFDRTLNPGGPLGNVVNPLTGQPIRGGLVYAGVNGAPEHQGNPPAAKISPRLGMVYSLNPKTVVRAGYGLYWAPWNYQGVSATNYGNVGFTQDTFISQHQFFPRTSLTDPFPGGIATVRGSARGALEGVGGAIEFIDQDKKAPMIHQYSVDLARELPGNIAIGFEYVGATGRDLGLGGSNDGIININQVPTQYLSLGAGLTEAVPNPFFGLPASTLSTTSSFSTTSPTIPRRQLLRPFPQFGDILMRQATLGKSQYHAGVLKFEKRMSNGWGGRINYTYSRLMDNQFGEGNFFSQNPTEMQDAYNLDAEYSIGLLDVPHKIAITPMIELPFGEGKRWGNGAVANAILGGWTISSIISLESGFPVQIYTQNNSTNIFTRTQRANPGTGDAETSGSRHDRIATTPAAGCVNEPCGTGVFWLNRQAFSTPATYTLGTLPRTLSDVRTPHRNNWDFVAAKSVNLKGSMRGEIKLEVLNVTNTPKVRGPETRIDNANFGQVTVQSGFMRLTQLMFRLSF